MSEMNQVTWEQTINEDLAWLVRQCGSSMVSLEYRHIVDCLTWLRSHKPQPIKQPSTKAGQEKSCETCGTGCSSEFQKYCGPCLNLKHWTPRQPESETSGNLTAISLAQFRALMQRVATLERRLDAVDKAARTNPYHPFDVVGAVKDLQAGVDKLQARQRIEDIE